jgi:hypothetical protein
MPQAGQEERQGVGRGAAEAQRQQHLPALRQQLQGGQTGQAGGEWGEVSAFVLSSV